MPHTAPLIRGFRIALLLIFVAALSQHDLVHAADWTVPVAGNSFSKQVAGDREGRRPNGHLQLTDDQAVYCVFFRVDRPSEINLRIRSKSSTGNAAVNTRVANESFRTSIDTADFQVNAIGSVEIREAGYVRVEFQGVQQDGLSGVEISDVVVSSGTEGLTLDFVRTNEGNMFYWGRRGPSVHLRYEVPADKKLQYAYSEITVPEGQDPIGSYFMTNGFSEGYFGIQVNGPDERRVLFSVWSPFKTDNPNEIPPEQRIATLGKGPGVHVGKFGNEGSGGQSYLVYPWQAGATYRFLTEVVPDGTGNTVYTAWFSEKSPTGNGSARTSAAPDSAIPWRLIASFRRPQTDTHLKGFHSFLENFSPSTGHLGRLANYANAWVRDIDGQWHECTTARFSVDATGRSRNRLDFTGGAEGKHFYLRNCGFFAETGMPGESFMRESTAGQRPEIAFDQLPRGFND